MERFKRYEGNVLREATAACQNVARSRRDSLRSRGTCCERARRRRDGTGATRRHAADPQASEPQKAWGVPCLPEAERVRSVPHGKRKMEWRRGATAESEQLLPA